jgi:hypothetical protein
MTDQSTPDNVAPAAAAPEPPATPTDADAGDLLAALRDDKFFASARDERDVSVVYIDRRSQHFAAAPEANARHADHAARTARRIGDLVVSSLPAGEVATVQATFTAPSGYDAALHAFRTQGLLILHAPAGSGKRSAAIHLLTSIRFADGAATIYELNPDLTLSALNPADLPADTPLLLETPTGAALAGMNAFRWSALLAELGPTRRNNGLIITTEQAPEALARDQRTLLWHWQAAWPGDRTAVQWNILTRHLTHLLRQENADLGTLEAALDAWRQHAPLAALLAQRLMPYQLADLAAVLLPVLTGAYPLDHALARHELQVADAVQSWFADPGHTLASKTLLIAAAVYNGALADEVELAADALLARVAPPAAKTPPTPVDPFAAGATRSARYKQIKASLVSTPIQGLHYGATTGLALRLDNDAWQKAVLNHLWSEYGALREPLLEWLERAALDGSPRLRVRAAAAIGALARLNFPLIEARILRAWARHAHPDARRAAGQVLGIAMWDEQHSAAASGLLRHWAASENWRFRWSAATACGGLAGLRHPQQALDILRRIAERCVDEPQLLAPVSEAVLKLYIAVRDDPARRAAIIHTLRAWCEPAPAEIKERARIFALRRTALFSFWAILWPAPQDPAWRQLTADMAVPAAPVQEDGIALLRAAFTFRQPADSVHDTLHPRQLARQGLRALIDAIAAEGDADLTQYGAGLLHAFVAACQHADARSGGEESAQLRYYAETWDDLSPAAAELRDILL